MRRWASSAVVVTTCLMAVACQSKPLSDQDIAAIQKSHDEYVKMFTAGNADVSSIVKMYYTDTARVLPPDMPALDGQAAIIRGYVTQGQARTFKFGPLQIDGQGGTAYVDSTWEGTFVPPGGGEPFTEKGKGLEVFQKQPDGSWKATRDMWNSDAPPSGLVVPTGALKPDASAELKQLDWFAGKWTLEGEAKAASIFGPAGKTSFTMDCRWFMGGSSLACTVDGMTPAGPYHDLMIHTYDADAKTYRGFDNDNTGMSSPFTLSFDKEGWTYTYDLKMNGKPTKLRMKLTDVSKDTCSYKQEVSTAGGPFTVILEGKGRKLPG